MPRARGTTRRGSRRKIDGSEPVDEAIQAEAEETPARPQRVRRATTRAGTSRADTAVEGKLAGGIKKLGEIRSRTDEELGDVLKEDASKMASVLTLLAMKGPPPVKIIVGLLAELLAPLDAFGRTAAILFRRFRERQARLQAIWEEEQAKAAGVAVYPLDQVEP